MKFVISEDPEFFDVKLRMLKHLRRAANKFSNRCESADHILALSRLSEVPIEISINKKLASTYGQAFKIPQQGKVTGILIELNQAIQYYSPPLIYQIVSHEFAHGIDFLIRGDSFHDAEWAAIHHLMDGHGTTFIECP